MSHLLKNSQKKLGLSERQALVAKLQEEKESKEEIMLDEHSDVDISDYGEEAGVKKKTFRGL